MRRFSLRIIALSLSLLSTTIVHATDLVVEPKEAASPNVVKVVSTQARALAVSDLASVIVVANRPPTPEKPGELAIFGIDAQGNVVAAPAPAPAPAAAGAVPAPTPPPTPFFTVVLPRPASVAKFINSAQHLLFHPKLPLLYVWQDITGPPFSSIKNNATINEFDHLLIYSFAAGQPPKLELATCRGPQFMYNVQASMLAIDPAGKRLMLPSLRALGGPDNSVPSAVGYFKLDEHGMSLKDGDHFALTVEEIPAYNYIPSVLGCAFISDTVSIFGSVYGPVTWDTNSRRCRFACYWSGMPPYTTRLIPHPTLPVIYTSAVGMPVAMKMEHVDGNLTMMPQQLTFTGMAITSPPVLMIKSNRFAVGSSMRVLMISLDAAGNFVPPATFTPVNCTGEAIDYSEKFDRVYVGCEKTP